MAKNSAKYVRGPGRRAFRVSRPLCGVSPEEFGVFLVAMAPWVAQCDRVRETRPGRLRAAGAGRKAFPLQFRLLVALTHLRLKTSGRETGAIFEIDEATVRSYRNELEEFCSVNGIVPPDGGEPICSSADLGVWLTARVEADPLSYVIVDGTAVPRQRPGGSWAEQRPAYSGKHHDHVVKATVVTDEDGNVIWFEANPNGEGRTHDLAMLRSQEMMGAFNTSGITVLADSAYRKLDADLEGDVYVPVRRPNKKKDGTKPKLTRDERLYNRAVGCARVKVEHGIGAMKRWGKMRQHDRAPDVFGRVGTTVAVINSMVAQVPATG